MGSLQERIDELDWYHCINLPDGVVTPGLQGKITEHLYRFPEDLAGQRVLDVGAWDGKWTFKAVQAGAKEVVAIDNFTDYPHMRNKKWSAFDLCKEALGYTDKQCHRHEMTLYDLTEEHFGRFDLILFYGVLYHCRYPMLALDVLSAVCDGTIRVESAIVDDTGAYGKGYAGLPVAEFYPGWEFGKNNTNWWGPTLAMIEKWLMAAGWPKTTEWKLFDDPREAWQRRGLVIGERE